MGMIGKDIDMSRELTAKDNLRKSKIITVGSTFFAAIVFLVVYLITENYWLLGLTFVMVISGAFFIYFVNQFERKYFSNFEEDKESNDRDKSE